jgi:beta-galactosidase beta subunit
MEIFASTFTYLDEMFRPGSPAALRLAAAAAGATVKIELTGGAFALEQVYLTKARPEGFFESHRQYIDVQVVVAGEAAIFFPVDGHMPGLRPGGVAGLVRKTVIKVPVPV